MLARVSALVSWPSALPKPASCGARLRTLRDCTMVAARRHRNVDASSACGAVLMRRGDSLPRGFPMQLPSVPLSKGHTACRIARFIAGEARCCYQKTYPTPCAGVLYLLPLTTAPCTRPATQVPRQLLPDRERDVLRVHRPAVQQHGGQSRVPDRQLLGHHQRPHVRDVRQHQHRVRCGGGTQRAVRGSVLRSASLTNGGYGYA